MSSTIIIYESGTEAIASAVCAKLENAELIELEDVLKSDSPLNAKIIGIFSKQENKGVSSGIRELINEVLPVGDVEKIQYLFSVCVGISKPFHSLKIIERLCMKNGLASSYNVFVDVENRKDIIKEIVNNVLNGNIKLAYGSLFTRLYMLIKGIK